MRWFDQQWFDGKFSHSDDKENDNNFSVDLFKVNNFELKNQINNDLNLIQQNIPNFEPQGGASKDATISKVSYLNRIE